MHTTKRCFIAFNLPERVKDEILNAIGGHTREVKRVADVKFVSRENLHITAKFLGNISESTIEDISRALTDLSRNLREVQCELHPDLGCFPSENHIRVVWVGVSSDDKLENMMREIDDEISKIGFRKEKNYIPHITVFRVKKVHNKNRLRELLKKSKIPKVKFILKEVVLYESVLRQEGPTYLPLKVYHLSR